VKPDRRRMKKDKNKVEDTILFEREKDILVKSKKTLMAQQLEEKITMAEKKTTRQGGKNFGRIAWLTGNDCAILACLVKTLEAQE
jgi:hypothetical protein